MGLTKFQIEYDSPSGVYYPGQTVSGRVLLHIDEPLEFRAILIRIAGEAEVKWTETRTEKRNNRTIHHTDIYTGHQSYLETKYNLAGVGNSKTILPAGQYTYPFSQILPTNLVSTFEGTWGRVRYSVHVNIGRPWKFDHNSYAVFYVISPLDLRFHPTASHPLQMSHEKKFKSLFKSSGGLEILWSLPVSGFVSGEEIPVTVDIANKSHVDVVDVNCALRLSVNFHAMSPTRKTRRESAVLRMVTFGSVQSKLSLKRTIPIVIPHLPSYNLTGCNIIEIVFDLKLQAKVGMFHRSVTLKMPIVIGTVPFDGTAVDSDGVELGGMFVPGGGTDGFHMKPMTIANDLPPSYEAAVLQDGGAEPIGWVDPAPSVNKQ